MHDPASPPHRQPQVKRLFIIRFSASKRTQNGAKGANAETGAALGGGKCAAGMAMHAGTPPDERPGVNREFFPPETPAAPLLAGCGPCSDGGEGLFQSRLRRRPRTTTSRGSCSRLWTQIGADYGFRVDGGRGGWRELGGQKVYLAYLRDVDGHKLSAVYRSQ